MGGLDHFLTGWQLAEAFLLVFSRGRLWHSTFIWRRLLLLLRIGHLGFTRWLRHVGSHSGGGFFPAFICTHARLSLRYVKVVAVVAGAVPILEVLVLTGPDAGRGLANAHLAPLARGRAYLSLHTCM